MVEIEKLDHLGRGIGRINNKIIFIPNTLPNEIVDVKIIKEKKSFYEGKVHKYIKLSDDRIKPICPYFEICGGCDLMHLSYDNQLKYKQEKIQNIMNNLNIKINKIVKSDEIYNYRNKISFQVNNKLGLFEKNSNSLIDIDKCYIANENINNIIPLLKEINLESCKQIICKSFKNQMMIIIESDKKINIPEKLKNSNINIYQKCNKKYINISYNKPIITNIGDKKYQVSPDSFFQVNPNTTKKLYDKIKKYCLDFNSKYILDLYCGTGTIGIYVSNNAKEVLGIEINKDAIKDAKNNAILNNISNIKFICNDVLKELDNITFKPDTIIVDPPRAGLNKDTIKLLLKFKAKHLIYVSCDPLTLKRDLEILKDEYNIIELTPFDMFPHTHHCESIVLLKLK